MPLNKYKYFKLYTAHVSGNLLALPRCSSRFGESCGRAEQKHCRWLLAAGHPEQFSRSLHAQVKFFHSAQPSIIPRGKSFVWGSEKQLSHCPAQLLALAAWKQKGHVATLAACTGNCQLKSLLELDLLCHTKAEGRYYLLGALGIIFISHYAGRTTRAVALSLGPACSSSRPAQDGN